MAYFIFLFCSGVKLKYLRVVLGRTSLTGPGGEKRRVIDSKINKKWDPWYSDHVHDWPKSRYIILVLLITIPNVALLSPIPRGRRLGYDEAVIKLDKPVTFTDDIQPVCLADEGSHIPAGTIGSVYGWGHIAQGGKQHRTPPKKAPWGANHQIWLNWLIRTQFVSIC